MSNSKTLKRNGESYPFVSILILNYNGLNYVDRCLNSVLQTNYPSFEVIFIDNASEDGSYRHVKRKYGLNPRVRMIRNDRNYGFAGGNNVGVKKARGEYIVFLNVDTEVNPDWLKNLINTMESDPSIGAAQSKLLLMDDRKRIDTCGHMLSIFGFTHERGLREIDRGQYDYLADILGSKGAAMIVKRRILEEVGLFDEDYFALREETDLCWRIWLRGYRVVFIPTSIVYHAAGFLSKNEKEFSTWWRRNQLFYWYRNWLITLIKNLELKNLLKITSFFLLISSADAIISSLKSRSVHPLKSLLKALVYVILNLRRIWSKRVYVQRIIRRKRDDEIFPYITVKASPLEELRRRLRLRQLQA